MSEIIRTPDTSEMKAISFKIPVCIQPNGYYNTAHVWGFPGNDDPNIGNKKTWEHQMDQLRATHVAGGTKYYFLNVTLPYEPPSEMGVQVEEVQDETVQ